MDGVAANATLTVMFNSPEAVAINPSTNDLFVMDRLNNLIRKINAAGDVSTFAGIKGSSSLVNGPTLANATFPQSFGMVMDPSGNLYVSDQSFNCIRLINVTSNIVTTIAGNSSQPYGSGVFNGDGPALSSTLFNPTALAFDNSGNLIIADSGNRLIRKLVFNSTGSF